MTMQRVQRRTVCVLFAAAAAAGCGGGSDASVAAPGFRRADTATDAEATGPVELLQAPYDWSRFSGTHWDGQTLTAVPLDRRIRPKTSGKWYANPPINLAGPRLDFTEGFDVQIEVDVDQHPDKAAFVDLYGSLPIGYDEWRIDGRHVRWRVVDGTAEVWVNMVQQDMRAEGLGARATLGLAKRGSTLVFSVDGQEIGRFEETPAEPVFADGKLYFGLDAELGGGFAVTRVAVSGAQVVDNGAELIRAYESPTDSLRALASQRADPLWIGTAANADALLADPRYGPLLAQQASMITPELHFKFQAIHPQPAHYAFAEADALVAFAEANAMRVHGHTLVWHEALPQWVWDLYAAGDRDALKQALMEHIAALVTRYRGRVAEWDTLNEIFSTESAEPFGLRGDAEQENNLSVWYRSFGMDIYVDALRKVKEIDPGVENWINEFGIDQASSSGKLDNMIAFVRHVNGLGYGRLVDGIGFQSHNYDPVNDPARADDLRAAMAKVIDQAQIKVRVSELDVAGASGRPGLFSDKLAVCLDLVASNGCRSFGMWGLTDRYASMSGPDNGAGESNLASPNWGATTADSLAFDAQYRERSAVPSLRTVLQRP